MDIGHGFEKSGGLVDFVPQGLSDSCKLHFDDIVRLFLGLLELYLQLLQHFLRTRRGLEHSQSLQQLINQRTQLIHALPSHPSHGLD